MIWSVELHGDEDRSTTFQKVVLLFCLNVNGDHDLILTIEKIVLFVYYYIR